MTDKMADTQRVNILQAYRDRLKAKFGANTSRDWFRKFVQGIWLPSNNLVPAVYVVDDGQKKAMVSGDAEDSKQQILSVKLVLHLAAAWDREEEFNEWSNRVQTLALDPVLGIQNWLPGYGVIRNDYTGDEPFTVMIGEAEAAALWIVEFEAEYISDVGALGKA